MASTTISKFIEHDGVIVIDDEDDNEFPVQPSGSDIRHLPPLLSTTQFNKRSSGSIVVLSSNKVSRVGSARTSDASENQTIAQLNFRTLDWATRVSSSTHRSSFARSPRSPASVCSVPSSSTTRTSFASNTYNSGTIHDPICLESTVELHSLDLESAMPPKGRGKGKATSPGKKEDRSLSKQPSVTDADSRTKAQIIDLEDDAENESRFLEIYHIDPDEPLQKTMRILPPPPQRNPAVEAPWSILKTHSFNGINIREGKTVELENGDFLTIKRIIYHSGLKEVRVRGLRFQRTKDFNGLLERKINELVLFLEVDLDDERPPMEQGMVEHSSTEIKKIRTLRWTNQKFPLDRNMDPEYFQHNHDRMLDGGGLTCRWKYTCEYATGRDRIQNVPKEKRLERFLVDEVEQCTKRKVTVLDGSLRARWRGETIRGGASWWPTEVPGSSESSQGDVASEERDLKPAISISRSSEPDGDGQQRHSLEKSDEVRTTAKRREGPFSLDDDFDRRASKKVRLNGTTASDEVVADVLMDSDEAIEGARKRLSLLPTPSECDTETRSNIDLTKSDGIEFSTSNRSVIDISAGSDVSNLTIDPDPPAFGKIIDLVLSRASTPEGDTPSQSSLVPAEPQPRKAGQTYTYGDAFCGAGGSTRGAHMAGLKVLWGYDRDPYACQSWRVNFPSATNFQIEAQAFVTEAAMRHPLYHTARCPFKVDILHLSPPCQFFSPAHTIPGKNDDVNIASLFAVQSVIMVARPRVVTLEQTFGITNERFRWFFNALVHMFTSQDFSLRWEIVHLQQWGLPQRRSRLIMIASCPGEPLPSMPKASHMDPNSLSRGSPLKPFVTVSQAISRISPHATHHDPHLMPVFDRLKPAYSKDAILPRAMTTSGGQNYHPSGKRDLTNREYACLQGFPENHAFEGKSVKRQIGNAVPPVCAKVLFESVKRDLERVDGVRDGGIVVLD